MVQIHVGINKLGEGHGQELTQTRDVLDLVLAEMIGHTVTKRAQGQIEHELRQYELALVSGSLGRKTTKNNKKQQKNHQLDVWL